jgi:hypothetical protein
MVVAARRIHRRPNPPQPVGAGTPPLPTNAPEQDDLLSNKMIDAAHDSGCMTRPTAIPASLDPIGQPRVDTNSYTRADDSTFPHDCGINPGPVFGRSYSVTLAGTRRSSGKSMSPMALFPASLADNAFPYAGPVARTCCTFELNAGINPIGWHQLWPQSRVPPTVRNFHGFSKPPESFYITATRKIDHHFSWRRTLRLPGGSERVKEPRE